MSTSRPQVCVVGAGISGLKCADVLLKNGCQVTILEARDRIGGRMCQSNKLGYKVDIGPNWIHTSAGETQHPLRNLAEKTKTPLHHWNDKQNIFNSLGKLIPDDKADRLSSLLWAHIEEAFKHSIKNFNEISSTESLYDFLSSKAKTVFATQSDDEELLLQMSQMWGAYIGDQVSRQSLKFAWLEECCGGEDELFVETTWEAILMEIANPALEKAEIKLNQKVVRVETKNREMDGGKVVVITEKGESFEFDEVVMTTPLGWLKRNQGVFEPPLPDRLITGINGISVGHLEKVFITFPEAFWLDPSANGEDTFAGYTNWLSPTYAENTNPSHWPVEMWNLASFSPENRHPTMIFYLYGDCSEYLISLVHGKSVSEHYKLLDAFFRPYYSLLPNFSELNPSCTPKAILSTEWQKDELSGFGSYCNVQVGATDADGDIKAMRHGVPERRLWFCGEHTSPFEELGTVVGAYLSGQRVAERILDINGVKV